MTNVHNRTATAEVTVQQTAERLYALVSDVTRMSTWSPECVGCSWLGDGEGALEGRRFRGRNRRGRLAWSTTATVIEADEGRTFAFRVHVLGRPTATWKYEFLRSPGRPGATVVRESWADHRGPVSTFLWDLGVPDRRAHAQDQIEQTLRRLAEHVGDPVP